MNYSLKATLFLVFAAVSIVLIEREDQRKTFDPYNRSFLDWLVGNAWTRIAPSQVTLLRVNPKELEQDNLDPRLDWAIILRSLETFDPKSVAIVPSLNWDKPDQLAEGALNKRVISMPPLTLGATFGAPGQGAPNLDVSKMTALTDLTGDLSQLPVVRNIVAMPDPELLANGKAAFTQIELNEETASGPNGIRFPLLAKVGDKVVPSFVLQVIMHQEDIPADQVKVILEGPRPIIRLGKHTVPVDRDGCFTVYHGMKGSFPSLEFSSLALAASPFEEVAEKLRKASKESIESLRTNAVIIGYDQEEMKEFALPTGERISRAELIAMAVATIQTGRHITYWPDLFRYASWALLAVLGLALFRARRFRVFSGALAILLLYGGVSIAIFQTSLSWTPPWSALGICAVLLVLGILLPSPKRKLSPIKPDPQEPPSEEASGS
ncbi:MAG: hypothetical protein DVB23_003066 [Verrucomicrobia bacterium]|nr:MAG: hypothetical protein DVB23_003066 [Verrucomicrobiota bacterium]